MCGQWSSCEKLWHHHQLQKPATMHDLRQGQKSVIPTQNHQQYLATENGSHYQLKTTSNT